MRECVANVFGTQPSLEFNTLTCRSATVVRQVTPDATAEAAEQGFKGIAQQQCMIGFGTSILKADAGYVA
jgi:hypothetical protein